MEIRKFHPDDMRSVTHLLQAVSKFDPRPEDLEQLANLFLADETPTPVSRRAKVG